MLGLGFVSRRCHLFHWNRCPRTGEHIPTSPSFETAKSTVWLFSGGSSERTYFPLGCGVSHNLQNVYHERLIVISIIFVNGLGAFPDTTWQKRPEQTVHAIGSEQQNSWIRDFLAQDLRQARLMFFNYDSTTYNDAPQKDLQDIGTELLQAFDVSRLRKSPSVCPSTFGQTLTFNAS